MNNLGIQNKKVLHDLGCGPGKLLIQSFLSYSNLVSCMGIELAIGRYLLAEKNFRNLVEHGYEKRSFRIVAEKKNEFVKIAEVTNQLKSFKKGTAVIVFNYDSEERELNNPAVGVIETKCKVDFIAYDTLMVLWFT
eukprot:UN09578